MTEYVTKDQVLEILQKHYPYATLREEHAMHRAVQEIKALSPVEAVSCSGLFDKEETYTNCTVQVLTNTVTGDVSIGWWQNEEE
jgi:hypothetical protein